MKKRIAALLMAALMAVGMVNVNAFAEEETVSFTEASETVDYSDLDIDTTIPENDGLVQAGGLLLDEDSDLMQDLAAADDADSDEELNYDHAHDSEIMEAIQNRQDSLDVSGWDLYLPSTYYDMEDEVIFLIVELAALYKHPEIYYMSDISCTTDANKKVLTIDFSYENASDEEIAKFNQAVAFAKSEMEKQISDDMTDLEKALVIHDYITATTHYDYTDYLADEDNMPESVYNMYGVLVNHSAVCQGYAEAFEYFANYYGINCELASSNEANHAWNVVELDGKWYHLDTTWDDPVWDVYGKSKHKYFLMSSASLIAGDSDKSDFYAESAALPALKEYFPELITDEYIAAQGDSFTEATDKTYESGHFWSSTIARTYHCNANDTWYYVNTNNGNLMSYDYDTDTSSVLTSNSDSVWYVLGSDTSTYSGYYNQLYGEGKRIYYSTANAINVYNIDAGQEHVYYTADTSSGYIYGFGSTDGVMGYTLETNPKPSGDETIYAIDGSNVSADKHIWNGGTVTKEPTTTAEGETTYTCTVCGETMTEPIAKVELLKPTATITATASGTNKVKMTGTISDFANIAEYYPITARGIVYMTSAKLGTRELTFNTSGRTKVSFGTVSASGTFSYTMRPSSKATLYTARAFVTYTDGDGNSVTVYSDPYQFSYNNLK